MRPGNDVGSDQTVADPLAGIGSGTHSGVHSTGFTPHHHSDVTTADKFPTDQRDFRSLGHRISGLDRRHHTTGLDHSQSDT